MSNQPMPDPREEFTPTVESVSVGGYAAPTLALQTRSSFQTAVAVNRERNLLKIEQRCIQEAAIAGEEFYYSWKQGGENIEGLSVGAALAIVRNFGNCAVEVQVQETPTAYIFNGVFIDLETGFNIVRPFRQNKQSPKTKEGKDIYSGDRGQDVIFQIGTSKAIRNVALNAMPKWLTEKVIREAKRNVVKRIEEMGSEKAIALCVKKALALGIAKERIENVYGKERSWDTEKIIKITSAIRAIEDGVERATELFPMLDEQPVATNASVVNEPKKEAAAPVKEEKKAETEQKPAGEAPAPKTARTPKELYQEMMITLNELAAATEIPGWKKVYGTQIDTLTPGDQAKVLDMLAAREAELNRATAAEEKPAEKKNAAYEQLSNFIKNARTKKELAGMVKRITEAENEGKMSGAERTLLIEQLNARLAEE